MWEINTEGKLPKLNDPIFIEGLPGIGNVGKIAVDFLIEELKAKKLYSFFSYKFPNSVFVNEKNLIEMPKIEMYYKQFGAKSRKRDLLLLTGDIQPIDEESCYAFCDELIKIVKSHGCSEIITTGGIGLQNLPEDPKVYCTANDAGILKEYLKKGLPVKKEIFGVVGPIIGVSGVLLGLAGRRKIKGVSLLAETFGNPLYLGIKGAKEIIKVLEIKFKLGVNIKKLNKDIVELENELVQKTQEWASEELVNLQAGAKAKNQDIHYIG